MPNNIAKSYFVNSTKTKLKFEWLEQTMQLLADDIGRDPDAFRYMTFSDLQGRKIITRLGSQDHPSELEIPIIGGYCVFDTLVDKFLVILKNLLNKKISLKHLRRQQEGAARAMLPAVVNALRDTRYSYPYKQDTKDKVIQIAPYIKILARDVEGAGELALAGAIADSLENELKDSLQSEINRKKQEWMDYIEGNPLLFTLLTQLLLSLRGRPSLKMPINPGMASIFIRILLGERKANKLPLDIDLIELIGGFPEPIQTGINKFIWGFIRQAIMYLFEEEKLPAAKFRDEKRDAMLAVEVLSAVDFTRLSSTQKQNLQKELDRLIAKVEQTCVGLYSFPIADAPVIGKIIQRAKMIESKLVDLDKIPGERSDVTKWERFYHYFSG